MTPTILRAGELRFHLFAHEEPRIHVHIQAPEGRAMIWIEPRIELTENRDLSTVTLNRALREIRTHEDQIREGWHEFLGA